MKTIKILAMILMTSATAWSQQVIYYTGTGRAVVSNDHLAEESNFLRDDSLVSERRDLNGQFIFDLGVNIEPNESMRAKAVLRLSNEFGGFFSNGSLLQFRQVTIQGVINNKINYQIGDIDLKMTPYTLINNEDVGSKFESELFGLRRRLIDYENFNVDDNWRLQGANASTKLKFTKGIESLGIDAFGTRIKKSDFVISPDRLLMGGTLNAEVMKYLSVGGRVVSMLDVVGTSPDTATNFKNTVLAADVTGSYEVKETKLKLLAEFGRAEYSFDDLANETSLSKDDFFYDVSANAKGAGNIFDVTAGYRYVGPRFLSPGAQTRRVYADRTPTIFQTGLNGTATRSQTLFDRMNDPLMYNQSLSPVLMAYNIAYNNVNPYGQATPNRQGLSLVIASGHVDSVYFAEVKTQLLSETIGEGVVETRKYSQIKGGAQVRLDKVLNMENDLVLSAGFRTESTSRGGQAKVDLSSAIWDAALSYEVLKNLELMAGIKLMSATGNEFVAQRDQFNEIIDNVEQEIDFSESINTFGARYWFSETTFIIVNGMMLGYSNVLQDELDYNLNQLYFNYTMRF